MTNEVKPLAVVAVGGNALIRDSSRTSIPDQFEAACATAEHLADLIVSGWRVILTHGNGPQVGFILRRSELAAPEVAPVPMPYACADIQGAVGFMFVTALENALRARGADLRAACVVTRVRVDRDDPAFLSPTKPIGAHMTRERAETLARENGWTVRDDAGRGWRRVVASPIPKEILDLDTIRHLADRGYTVVGCGGGGIPVVRTESGGYDGIDAVIDKDLASSLLARELGADALVICTGVEKVALEFGTPRQRDLDRIPLAEAERYMAEGHFHVGSMLPKVQAVVEFVRATGGLGLITDAEHVTEAMRARAGTRILPTQDPRGVSASHPDRET